MSVTSRSRFVCALALVAVLLASSCSTLTAIDVETEAPVDDGKAYVHPLPYISRLEGDAIRFHQWARNPQPRSGGQRPERDTVWGAQFSVVGKFMICASSCSIYVWNLGERILHGELLVPGKRDEAIDGRRMRVIATTEDSIQCWDALERKTLWTLACDDLLYSRIWISHNGKWALVSRRVPKPGAASARSALLVSIERGEVERTFDLGSVVGSLDLDCRWSPDDSRFLLHLVSKPEPRRDSYDVFRLFERATGARLHDFSVPEDAVFVDFSPRGEYLCTYGYPGAWVFNAYNGCLVAHRQHHLKALLSGSDGRLWGFGFSGDMHQRDAYLWDILSGKRLKTFRDFGDFWGADRFCFSPDGKYLAFGQGNAVTVYDAATTRPIYRNSAATSNTCVAFSPDSKWFFYSNAYGLAVLRPVSDLRLDE